MTELFEKNEINPTVKVVVSMNQDEKNSFKAFAEKMNVPFSAMVRMAIRNFMNEEGLKYVEK